MSPWKLKRTVQCAKCPWRKDCNPHEIPRGYSVEKHRALKTTIAKPGDISGIASGAPLQLMACHDHHETPCIGWLMNQVGSGNNIPLRLRVSSCENFRNVRLVGDQHETFEDTLPEESC